ncbi:reverse transcriptase domain-containing protein [Tanacetum coccineum]
MMTNKYCPRGEIKKLEIEIWNLKVEGTDVVSYTRSFQELALMCGEIIQPMCLEDIDELRYAIKIANELMDQKVRAYTKRQAENKRKPDNNNQAQQQPPKKQSVVIAYIDGSGERKEYAGTLPLCNKCKFHHNGICTIKCANYKRVGHLTQDCRSLAATNNQRTLTCYEYENQGHYRSDCPELKNRNHGNQAGGTEVRGMVYALGGARNDQVS